MGEQEVVKKRKKKEHKKVEFDVGKVFKPGEAKDEDFKVDLDRDTARYKARKGEGGDRKQK